MSGKRKRKLKERENRRSRLRERSVSSQPSALNAAAIHREIDYITQRAAEYDARCVTLGVLVFFSTETGDAWILDAEDNLAHCLARAGDRQAVRIVETETQFGIDWPQAFSIQDDLFCTLERATGRVSAIHGYPTEHLLAVLERARLPAASSGIRR